MLKSSLRTLILIPHVSFPSFPSTTAILHTIYRSLLFFNFIKSFFNQKLNGCDFVTFVNRLVLILYQWCSWITVCLTYCTIYLLIFSICAWKNLVFLIVGKSHCSFDISKAFDRFWYVCLPHKLKSGGISGQISAW